MIFLQLEIPVLFTEISEYKTSVRFRVQKLDLFGFGSAKVGLCSKALPCVAQLSAVLYIKPAFQKTYKIWFLCKILLISCKIPLKMPKFQIES